MHAETTFTAVERKVIDRSARELSQQIPADIRVVYDNSEIRPRLVKVTSEDESVKDLDHRIGGITFGWVGLSQKIRIVRDRIWTDRMLAHVFMHEVLHVLGAEHVKDERSIMYEQTDLTHTATVLTEADRAALRAARK